MRPTPLAWLPGAARLLAALAWACLPSGQAAITINYMAAPGMPPLADTTGLPLAAGNVVWLGTFAAGFDIAAHAHAPATLARAWRGVSAAPIADIFGFSGTFSASVTLSDPTLDGRALYFWAWRTSDNQAPAADFSNALEYGLFTGDAPRWTCPADAALPPGNTTDLTSASVTQALAGTTGVTGLRLAPFVWTPADIPPPILAATYTPAAGIVEIACESVSGWVYQVEAAATLPAPYWAPASDPVPGTGAVVRLPTALPPGAAQVYFRVAARPAGRR